MNCGLLLCDHCGDVYLALTPLEENLRQKGQISEDQLTELDQAYRSNDHGSSNSFPSSDVSLATNQTVMKNRKAEAHTHRDHVLGKQNLRLFGVEACSFALRVFLALRKSWYFILPNVPGQTSEQMARGVRSTTRDSCGDCL